MVTITGAGFVPGATSVKFGNAAATTTSCPSVTTCTAASPAGTGTAFVTVTTAAGISSTSTAAQFTYVPPPCTSVNVTSSVASPQTPGVSVAFTATAAGCATPEYRFLLLPPGGGWQVAREWGTGAWTWNTTGAPLGNYTISVWARSVGSAASWEAYKETPFTLSPPPPPPAMYVGQRHDWRRLAPAGRRAGELHRYGIRMHHA